MSNAAKKMIDKTTRADEYELSKGKAYSPAEASIIIEQSSPSLTVNSIEFIGQGMASCAYLVNSRYVFRLPKNEQVSKTLKREVCLLPKLKTYLNVRIPDIKFQVPESTPFGKVCVGYELIPGVPLDHQLWRTLSDADKKRLVDEITVFLNELHAFPIESALSCNLQVENCRQVYMEYESYFGSDLFPSLTSEEQEIVKRLFNEYFADSRNFQYKPALVHGDISPAHVLIDPATEKLTGIIDFGDMKVTDPDWDLIWLYEDFDLSFCEMLLRNHITDTEPERLQTKLNLFRLCVTTIFIREGIKEQNIVKTRMGWRYLRENIKEFSKIDAKA